MAGVRQSALIVIAGIVTLSPIKIIAGEISPETNINFSGHKTPPHWVVNPAQAGPDIPAIGQSLFSELFTIPNPSIENISSIGNRTVRLPVPFTKLEAHLQNYFDSSFERPIAVVLIPLGRSLQREAAAPDYFLYPRKLLAVVNDSPARNQHSTILRKNRLFIAYQEKSRQLEIISYNALAGRFEFQTVENYGVDLVPEISYANRRLCMSCHQNGAPIMAKSPWRESNFNPEVARAIATASPQDSDGLMDTMDHAVISFDLATDYANYFSTVQFVWQNVCGVSQKNFEESLNSTHCRATLLRALLQRTLSGGIGFDEQTLRQSGLLETSLETWNRKWPNGILIPTSDIPDLDPLDPAFNSTTLSTEQNTLLNPLSKRPPRAHWKKPVFRFFEGVIERMAGFVSITETRELDSLLRKFGSFLTPVEQALDMICQVSDFEGTHSRKIMNCKPVDASIDASVKFQIARTGKQITDLTFPTIRLPGTKIAWNTSVIDIKITDVANGTLIQGSAYNTRLNISSRLSDGNQIDGITLKLEKESELAKERVKATLIFSLVKDFSLLELALQTLVNETNSGNSNSLSPQSFQYDVIAGSLINDMSEISKNKTNQITLP